MSRSEKIALITLLVTVVGVLVATLEYFEIRPNGVGNRLSPPSGPSATDRTDNVATPGITLKPSTLPGPRSNPVSGIRPSFDCSKAKTPSERLICQDSELAQQEVRMSSTYRAVLEGLTGSDKTAFRRRHFEWFKEYTSKCNQQLTETDLKRCISDYLKTHTSELQAEMQSLH